MAQIQKPKLSTISLTYPTQGYSLGSSSQVVQIPLKLTQAVVQYDIAVTEGAFTGGTTPAWNASASNPIVTHFALKADEDSRIDADTQLLQEYTQETKGITADGLSFQLEMVDTDFATREQLLSTVFPSWYFNQVILYLTLPAVTSVSTGSPTAGAISVDVQEIDVPRALINFVPLRIKKLQVAKSYSLNGENDDTQFLGQTGAYKCILFAQSTGTQYGSLTDSQITEIKMILNDTATIRDNLWALLKRHNSNQLAKTPSTGYAMAIFMNDNEATRLLNLADTVNIKSVDVQFTNSSATTVYVTALKVMYM